MMNRVTGETVMSFSPAFELKAPAVSVLFLYCQCLCQHSEMGSTVLMFCENIFDLVVPERVLETSRVYTLGELLL